MDVLKGGSTSFTWWTIVTTLNAKIHGSEFTNRLKLNTRSNWAPTDHLLSGLEISILTVDSKQSNRTLATTNWFFIENSISCCNWPVRNKLYFVARVQLLNSTVLCNRIEHQRRSKWLDWTFAGRIGSEAQRDVREMDWNGIRLIVYFTMF